MINRGSQVIMKIKSRISRLIRISLSLLFQSLRQNLNSNFKRLPANKFHFPTRKLFINLIKVVSFLKTKLLSSEVHNKLRRLKSTSQGSLIRSLNTLMRTTIQVVETTIFTTLARKCCMFLLKKAFARKFKRFERTFLTFFQNKINPRENQQGKLIA